MNNLRGIMNASNKLRPLLHNRPVFALINILKVNKTTKCDIRREEAEPIQYFGSQAATWRAKNTHGGGDESYVWYQPYVVSISLAIFLIYFCMLREESDIDRKLEGNLFDQVKGLEETTLVLNYKYNKERGLDTKDIEQRLLELNVNVKDLDTIAQ